MTIELYFEYQNKRYWKKIRMPFVPETGTVLRFRSATSGGDWPNLEVVGHIWEDWSKTITLILFDKGGKSSPTLLRECGFKEM
jgi:hypothetical protein